MGEVNSTIKVPSVCGLWSAGVAALLSVYPLVFCCVHQFLLPYLEVLIQGTSPPREVSCKALPGRSDDVECFHVSYANLQASEKRSTNDWNSCWVWVATAASSSNNMSLTRASRTFGNGRANLNSLPPDLVRK